MTRTWIAIGLEVVFFASAFGWRSWVQWRRTGSTGFIRPRRGAPPAELVGSVGFVARSGAARRRAARRRRGHGPLRGARRRCGRASSARCWEWRVSRSPSSRSWRWATRGASASTPANAPTWSPLACSRRVRNPIFTAMLIATGGLVLLVPNPRQRRGARRARRRARGPGPVRRRALPGPHPRPRLRALPRHDRPLPPDPRRPVDGMTTTTDRDRLVRRGLWLAGLTIAWNVIEAVVAVSAGIAAGSLALVAFGFDSIIEVLSAFVVVWQFRGELRGGYDHERERPRPATHRHHLLRARRLRVLRSRPRPVLRRRRSRRVHRRDRARRALPRRHADPRLGQASHRSRPRFPHPASRRPGDLPVRLAVRRSARRTRPQRRVRMVVGRPHRRRSRSPGSPLKEGIEAWQGDDD